MSNYSIYEMVTERIIEQLEQGIIPWEKPWTGGRNGAYSRSTGRPYSLLNQLMLPPGEYLTFKQCQQEGGRVRKGEKGKIIVFWKMHVVEEENAKAEKVKKTVPLLKYYNVFRVDQCDGISVKYAPETLPSVEPDDEAEIIMQNYFDRSGVKVDIRLSDKAYYRPSTDGIVLPLREQFKNTSAYYSTAFHEMAHSTGHVSRLNRIHETAHYGSEEYSKEELVAEITAAALLNHAGLEIASSFRNTTAYIQSWLNALRGDKTLIVSASGKAEKAYQMILGEA